MAHLAAVSKRDLFPIGSEGFEPPTLGSEDRCSIQLSYEPMSCWRLGHKLVFLTKTILTHWRWLASPVGQDRVNRSANFSWLSL